MKVVPQPAHKKAEGHRVKREPEVVIERPATRAQSGGSAVVVVPKSVGAPKETSTLLYVLL